MLVLISYWNFISSIALLKNENILKIICIKCKVPSLMAGKHTWNVSFYSHVFKLY